MMKTGLTGIAVALLYTGATVSAKEMKVLTIGASFWSSGGAGYKVIGEMLASRGYTVATESTPGGPNAFHRMSLVEAGDDFSSLAASEKTTDSLKRAEQDGKKCLDHVKAKEWDYICFQAHSSEPFQTNAMEKTAAYIEALKKNKAEKTKIAACMTWVKEPGKQDYETIRRYYKEIAARHGLLLAPAGDAFEIVEKERPDIPIFRSDLESYKAKNPGKTDRHPSVYGQYLNSCVVFAVITGESPVGLPSKLSAAITDDFKDREGAGLGTPMDLPPDTARYLQETAWRVVQAAEKQKQND